MDRKVYYYSGKNPVVLALGDHYEIGNILRELGLNSVIQKYKLKSFNHNRDLSVDNTNTPYGMLDTYIRIVQGNEFGTIALVISPSTTNQNGSSSLQKVIEDIKPKDQKPQTLDNVVNTTATYQSI